MTAEDPLASYATATIGLNSVTTGNQARDDDLRSDNFSAAAHRPGSGDDVGARSQQAGSKVTRDDMGV